MYWNMGKEEWSLGAGCVIDGYTLLILPPMALSTIAYASCFTSLTSELLFLLSPLSTKIPCRSLPNRPEAQLNRLGHDFRSKYRTR